MPIPLPSLPCRASKTRRSTRRALLPWLALLLATALSSGCRTSETQRDVLAGFPPLAEGRARFVLYRPSNLAHALLPTILVAGADTGSVPPNSYRLVDVDPGEIVVAATGRSRDVLTLPVEEGDLRYVRLDPGTGFYSGFLLPVTANALEALTELERLEFAGHFEVPSAPSSAN